MARSRPARARRTARIHRNRLLAGTAGLAVLGAMLASTMNGPPPLPPREVACAQVKDAARGVQREFGERAPSQKSLDEMTRDICKRGFTYAPGTER